ncbi:hypothetical protein [Ureibacillus manganicus]|uniref:Transcriptional regulator n=1 Tax=Ureibacillus manganicus DSM 26584 TaxID=1384049 RepID=A0A0A3I5H5_9BACL|nr:hypothetical protein [Ureibacillus manganicus]KGR80051.1 hypothetical protein CD29_03620 [Ureibacillus manganicus DSM 26584]
MKIKIGAIGAVDSLKKLVEVASKDNRIQLIGFPYDNYDELTNILRENKTKVDQWIFSGQYPYDYAIRHQIINEEDGSFPPLHGISFLGTFLKIIKERGHFVSKISLDTIDKKIVQQLLSEFSLEDCLISFSSYEYDKSYEEIVAFHVEQHRLGNSEVAITGFLSVYLELTKRNIPCYRLVPSELAIQKELDLLVTRAQSQLYENSKVTIIGIDVLENNQQYTIYEKQKQSLELERELLELTEKLNGSLRKESGRVYIYTTHGDFELSLIDESILQTIREIQLSTNVEMNIGVGSGYTVYEAKMNSNLACEEGKQREGSNMIYIDENKKLQDILNRDINSDTLPELWQETFKKHNYNATIPLKIYRYIKLKQINQFGSDLITNLLKNTDRNTRRILSDLEKMGLLESVDEEPLGKRGRPKKIYTIVTEINSAII